MFVRWELNKTQVQKKQIHDVGTKVYLHNYNNEKRNGTLYIAQLHFSNAKINKKQDKIFRRKRLSTGANFIHVYLEIWDTGILKFNKFSM